MDELTVVIPLSVLIELDTFKKGLEVRNVNCRIAIRFLESLRKAGKECGCKLHDGIPYMNTIVKVAVNDDIDRDKVDNKIVLLAESLQGDDGVCIITEDIHERVIADIHNIEAESMNMGSVEVTSLYDGKAQFKITDHQLQEFMADHESKLRTKRELLPNQFCVMTDSTGEVHYGIYDADEQCIKGLKPTYEAWNIKPKKSKKDGHIIMEQAMLMHLLLDPKIKLVTAIGPSGCGKTLLTLACALDQTLGSKALYDKIIVMRPLVSIGKDIGALPGTKMEKLEPWMASTFDNLEYLLQGWMPKSMEGMYISIKDKIYELIATGKLELEAMNYIRGRSIPRQLIIVDDFQNATQDQAISILTRAGEGTKVVFLGDISKQQIDDHRLSPSSNGLTYIVDKAKGRSSIVGHITMEEIVRSELAQLGVEIGNEI
jgi:PhoH-like ATPase